MYFYTVLTKGEELDELNIVSLLNIYADKCIVVKEYGLNNNNLHYNLVYRVFDKHINNWKKHSKERLSALYPKEFIAKLKTTDYLISTKRCSSPANVIGGYLTKEEDAVRVFSTFTKEEIVAFEEQAQRSYYLHAEKIRDVYDFVEFKILPYLEDKYQNPLDLLRFAIRKLMQDRDPDVLRYYNQGRLVLDVVKAQMEQPVWFTNEPIG